MAKIKVHEIAKEFDIKSSEVIAVLAGMGIEGKAPASGLEDDQAEAVRKALEDAKIPMVSAEITMIPQNYVELTDEEAIKGLQKTLDMLDDDDDVQAVYHNWDE
jgi:transcriptional/translational regulatory protein YebC/TACO1